jgi:hypothetical protein
MKFCLDLQEIGLELPVFSQLDRSGAVDFDRVFALLKF